MRASWPSRYSYAAVETTNDPFGNERQQVVITTYLQRNNRRVPIYLSPADVENMQQAIDAYRKVKGKA